MTDSVCLYDLNDHCLLLIIEHLDLEDLSSLAECSQRFSRLARSHFAKKFSSNFVIDERVCGRIFRVFGNEIENITITANLLGRRHPFTDNFSKKDVRRTLLLIHKYCKNVKNIHTALDDIDGVYSMSSWMFSMFVAAETMRINNSGENSVYIINLPGDPSTSQPVDLNDKCWRSIMGWMNVTNLPTQSSADIINVPKNPLTSQPVDLNDKCWRSIMGWLNVTDLTAMAECSRRMLDISRSCFAEQWTSSTFTLDYSVEPTTLRIFGDLINGLWILTPNYFRNNAFVVEESDQLKILSLAHRYLPNVKRLRFLDVFSQTFGHPHFRELIRNVVTLEIGLWENADFGAYVDTMQCCAQLEHLWLDNRSLSRRWAASWDSDEFLVVQYPNLKTLHLGQIVRSENILLKFVQLHRNLESFSLQHIAHPQWHSPYLSRLKCLSKLKSFTFYGWSKENEPTDDGIVGIYECLSHWTDLTYLHIELSYSPPDITPHRPMKALTHCRLSIIQSDGVPVFSARPYSKWIQSMAEKMPILRVCEICFLSVAAISALVSSCPQLDIIYCNLGFNTIVEMTENEFMDIVIVCRRYRLLQRQPLQIYLCCRRPDDAIVAISAVSNELRINHSNIFTIQTVETKQIKKYYDDFESSLTGSNFHGITVDCG